MILGIGLDAVNIERMQRWKNNPYILERFFHPEELSTVKKRGITEIHSLAARFAAKEAFGKALGTGLIGFSLKECSIVNDKNGKPDLVLYGRAKEAFETFGGEKIFVALTHEHDYAIAVVIIEGGG